MSADAPVFTVMTQNAFGRGPRWPARRAALARRIAAVRPDVVGLQEVHAADPAGAASQAHELAALVGGYHVDFAPGRVDPSGACEGVALLCRVGIRERAVASLTLDRGDLLDRAGQRVVLCATLDLPGGVVDVLVTHLSLSHRARVRTVRELMAFAEAQRARSGGAGAVLVGDLNAAPGEPAIHALEGPLHGAWRDAWKHAHGARARGGTWPAVAPVRRIDYVFLQPPGAWKVLACEREPAGASDHRGLVARLRLVA